MCPGPKLFFLKYSNILRLSIYLNQPHLEKHNHGWFSRTRMGSRSNMRGRWPNVIFKQKFNMFVEGCLHHLSTIWWRPWKTELKDIKRFKTRIPPYCSQYTVHTILLSYFIHLVNWDSVKNYLCRRYKIRINNIF